MASTCEDAWEVLTLAATEFGDSVAYVDTTNHTSLTYSQLLKQSSRVASWLHSRGIQRGDRVAVMLHNCIEAVQLHFAAAALHAIVVNVNTHWVDREISLLLQDSSPQLVFVHPQYLAAVQAAIKSTNISGALPSSCSVETLILVDSAVTTAISESQQLQMAYTAFSDITADSGNYNGLHRPSRCSDSDGYEMYYTSGTTGRPKGVVLSQHIVVQHALGTIQGGCRVDLRWKYSAQYGFAYPVCSQFHCGSPCKKHATLHDQPASWRKAFMLDTFLSSV